MKYTKIFNDEGIKLKVMLNSLPTKGNLVYEYNPFRNYRLTENKYYFKGNYYTEKELETLYSITIDKRKDIDGKTNVNYLKLWLKNNEVYTGECPILYEKGSLIDFITDELSFSLEHPVHIIPLYSYDGSVNLILNDGINTPKLINSRFSATGKNTYEIIDRKGNNDTNIYDLGSLFNIDTSLYKLVRKIPKLKFLGTTAGGNLKVGSYHFYFKFSDLDGNETDFIAESGLVSIFIGFDSPQSINTGTKNENSTKQVQFILSNIDDSYDCVTVYYSRDTAELNENAYTEYKKIDKKFTISNASFANIVITGFEHTVDLTVNDINISYNIVDAANTSTVCLNMLFMANVHKPEIPYKELSDLSLRFLPFLKESTYKLDMDEDYNIKSNDKGYYDTNFIYYNTGYWGNELYRLGIVYILPNNQLSPVFNIRGGINIGTHANDTYYQLDIYGKDSKRLYIEINLEDGYLINQKAEYENARGVISFKPSSDTNKIYSIDVRADKKVIEELKKYVKGYFFVRLKRIPTILALGITIGIDKNAHTPTIPTLGGILDTIQKSLEKTYVETEDINGINFISEGFLSRYMFDLKKRSSGIWGKIGKVFAGVAIVAAAVAGSVITLGGAAVLGTAVITTTPFVTAATITTVGAAVVAGTTAAVITGVAAAVLESVLAIQRAKAKKELKGKYTIIPNGYKRVEIDGSRKLSLDFLDRIIIKDPNANKIQGILCPDYEVNLEYFNLIFTGNSHVVRSTKSQSINSLKGYGNNYFSNNLRHFYIPDYYDTDAQDYVECKIVGIPDSVKAIGLLGNKYRSKAGEAEEVWRCELIGNKLNSTEELKISSDLVRGNFGPYLAMDNYLNKSAETVEIMVPGYTYSNIEDYIQLRANDKSMFYAISDRMDIYEPQLSLQVIGEPDVYKWDLYRGDCYLCQFTHRVIRNFNDPTAPYNDDIVNENTWKNGFNPSKSDYVGINLGDVNAVLLGMWVTFRIRSSRNLNIRTLDGSNINEAAMTGHPRGYFPYLPMNTEGIYKTADSNIYNKGFIKTVSDKWNFELPDSPYIKNWFGTRIMYSDIHINDAFKNGFRVFLSQHYRDYTREYGEIIKLLTLDSNLLCIFEHGIALIPVNERAVAGEGSGGNVYINTSNVLPENPRIISDMYGSLWADSILKVPGKSGDTILYVYGVDTVAKKIWRTNGLNLECISDFRVLEFLNNNITLSERELTPKIGIRNVKTVYNAYKRDVLFTFYDNTYGFEEKVWNLCWNEVLLKFITFYSWVPSFMENINNIPFSFDRTTSKWIAKLGTSHTDNSFADGITLKNVIINDNNFKSELSLSKRLLPNSLNCNYIINFILEPDINHNNDFFEIVDEISSKSVKKLYLKLKENLDITDLYSELCYRNKLGHAYSDYDSNKIKFTNKDSLNNITYTDKEGVHKVNYFTLPIYKDITGKRINLPREEMINPDKIVRLLNIRAEIKIISSLNTNNYSDDYYDYIAGYDPNTTLIDMGYYLSVVAVIPQWNMQFLTTDFWKHGQSGLIDIADDIYPTYWYGKQHPFEFECIVVNDPSVHKIFTNLELVANKAKPESFHYEIIGESYDFAKDKPNIYFRQEALKALWQYNGEDIMYNKDFIKTKLKQLNKSADLIHKYYARLDTINEIEDYYIQINNPKGYNYNHLSGGEIKYYPNRLEYRICNHAKAVDVDSLNLDNARSIIEANCKYLEDRWKVTINPILICYKNEYEDIISKNSFNEDNSTWIKSKHGDILLPKLPIYNSPIPNKIKTLGEINFPKDNHVLSDLYDSEKFNAQNNWEPLDFTNWLNVSQIDRKEIDLKDKFIKIKIRYSGEELAIIDFLNTLYRISYA